jgi:hypothetical protein
MIFKRYNGKKVTADDPNWSKATWCVWKRVGKKIVHRSLPHAKSEQAARIDAENLIYAIRNGLDPTQLAAPPRGFVYIIASRGFHKIGRTTVLEARLAELRRSAWPSEIAVIHSAEVGDAKTVEKSLHDRFIASRFRGEWFQLNEQQVSDAIAFIESCRVLRVTFLQLGKH